MVDHHAYYVTNRKTKIRQAITDTSITLVERKTRVERKIHISAGLSISQEIEKHPAEKKLKLRHKGGEQDKITNKKRTENIKKIPSQT